MHDASDWAVARANCLAAKAVVLADAAKLRRVTVRPGDVWGGAVTALLQAQSSLAALDAARAAGLRSSSSARPVAASGVCG